MKEWWRQELLWSVRWLAADPEAALAAAPGVVTTDEIALDLDHWSMMARDWALLDGPSLALLDEIGREFASMSDPDRPELWEDVALGSLFSGERQIDRTAITGRFPVVPPPSQ